MLCISKVVAKHESLIWACRFACMHVYNASHLSSAVIIIIMVTRDFVAV